MSIDYRCRMSRRLVIVSVVVALSLAALVGLPRHLRINWTASLPRGLYAVTGSSIGRSRLVAVCPPSAVSREAIARGYLLPGSCPAGSQPLLKLVAGVAGDQVATGPDGVRINGALLEASAPRLADSHGRPMASTAFRGTLPARQVWLHAPNPRSWDSRYFGPLPDEAVVSTLTPLWTLP